MAGLVDGGSAAHPCPPLDPPLLLIPAFSPVADAATVPDYLKLTLTWPGNQCRHSKCCLPTTGEAEPDFLVQDMKAYTLSSSNPLTNCKTDSPCRFSINALADVITELYGYWPDLSCPSNNGLNNWNSIWCTHGSCSGLNQTGYFIGALALRSKLDLLTLFEDNDIVQSETALYELTDVQEAIEQKFGFSTVLECTKDLVWEFPLPSVEYSLSKVHVCVKDAKLIIDCPNLEKSNCGDKIKFKPFTSKLRVGSGSGEGFIQMMRSA